MTLTYRIVARTGAAALEPAELADEIPAGNVRVRTRYSGMSTGTELSALRASGAEPVTIGYQLTGEVIATAPDLTELYAPGDLVACYGGPYVHHESQLNIPRHLVTRLTTPSLLAEACYCGLGTVAMHAFRRAGLALGETAGVIGLGMLGNLVAQVALAAGCRVTGLDTIEFRRTAAERCGIPVTANLEEFHEQLLAASEGKGADTIFVVVNMCPDDLLAHAVEFVRHFGNVVIVGTASARVPREALFSKEANITVSRAGGPGRYDREYEAEGHDYPYEHARWTEHRNLEEFIRLLEKGSVTIAPAVSDIIPVTDAPAAYVTASKDPASHLGFVFDWQGLSD